MKKEKYFTEKKVNGSSTVYCECGGQVAIGAIGYQKIPLGFGFAKRKNGTGFGIDYLRQKIYKGFCMDCGFSGVFKDRNISKKVYTKRIKKVDDVIKKNKRR